MFSQATDLFLIDLPEQGLAPRLGTWAARSCSRHNLTKTVFFDHLQLRLNRSLSSFALNYSVCEPLLAIVPQQEQGNSGIAGHGSDVTALRGPRCRRQRRNHELREGAEAQMIGSRDQRLVIYGIFTPASCAQSLREVSRSSCRNDLATWRLSCFVT